MISLLQTSSIVFKRGDGDYNVSGVWQEGVTVDTQTQGSLQPYQRGKTTLVLPEGLTENSALIYYTTTLLRPASQFTEQQADFAIIDGFKYIVFDVANWTRIGLSVDNYECLLIRQDVSTGGGV